MILRRSWSLFSLALLAAAPLASQLVPLGSEFPINDTGLHLMRTPVLELDGAGTLLAVWFGGGTLVARTFDRAGLPIGPERAFSTPGYGLYYPDATALGTGRFVMAWDRMYGGEGSVAAQILGRDGAPLGPEVRLDLDSQSAGGGRPQVDELSSGGFLATWSAVVRGPLGLEGRVVARPFDENGAPAAAETRVIDDWVINSSLKVLRDGGFLSVWAQPYFSYYPYPTTPPPPILRGRRFNAERQPATGTVMLSTIQVAAAPDGRFAGAWTGRHLDPYNLTRADSDVYVSFYDREGRRLSPEGIVAADGPGHEILEAVAMDEAGRFLVVWSNNLASDDPYVDADISARLYSAGGQPLGPAFSVASGPGDQFGATVAEKNGEWVISYVSEPANVYWGGEMYARRFATCVTDGSSLCLADRFRAEVSFQTGAGHGTGQARALTGDTGAFWFFSPENIELLVKAIDGSALNGHFWIFYGALSNVAYDVTVTDTATGEKKVYHNPAGTMASRADTRAFQSSGPPLSVVAPPPAPESTAADPLTCPPGVGFCCPPLPGIPCLHGGRFSVDVEWRIPSTGQQGFGQEVQLTNDSTYVWFFDKDNVELVIKILDGTAVNGKYWVFYGALSDVEYTIRVTDQLTGKVKTYHNPAGTMASRADTSAF